MIDLKTDWLGGQVGGGGGWQCEVDQQTSSGFTDLDGYLVPVPTSGEETRRGERE